MYGIRISAGQFKHSVRMKQTEVLILKRLLTRPVLFHLPPNESLTSTLVPSAHLLFCLLDCISFGGRSGERIVSCEDRHPQDLAGHAGGVIGAHF